MAPRATWMLCLALLRCGCWGMLHRSTTHPPRGLVFQLKRTQLCHAHNKRKHRRGSVMSDRLEESLENAILRKVDEELVDGEMIILQSLLVVHVLYLTCLSIPVNLRSWRRHIVAARGSTQNDWNVEQSVGLCRTDVSRAAVWYWIWRRMVSKPYLMYWCTCTHAPLCSVTLWPFTKFSIPVSTPVTRFVPFSITYLLACSSILQICYHRIHFASYQLVF